MLTLKLLNSLTKYPSIEAFHTFSKDSRPKLTNVLTSSGEALQGKEVYVTEKIDGTNVRLIFINGETNFKPLISDWDWFIGSRENLLMAQGDRIPDPQMGIAEFMRDTPLVVLEHLSFLNNFFLFVVYGELYGGDINAAGNYTKAKQRHFRIFDIRIWLKKDIEKSLYFSSEQISIKRDNNTLPGNWLTVPELTDWTKSAGFENVVTLSNVVRMPMNLVVENSLAFLDTFFAERKTKSVIDEVPGRAEGIVVRTLDRFAIAKLKFEDYEKLLKK